MFYAAAGGRGGGQLQLQLQTEQREERGEQPRHLRQPQQVVGEHQQLQPGLQHTVVWSWAMGGVMTGHLVGGGHRVLRGHPLPVLPVRPVCPRHVLASARHPDYP